MGDVEYKVAENLSGLGGEWLMESGWWSVLSGSSQLCYWGGWCQTPSALPWVMAWQAPLWIMPAQGNTECAGGLTAIQGHLTSWGNGPTGASESSTKRNARS